MTCISASLSPPPGMHPYGSSGSWLSLPGGTFDEYKYRVRPPTRTRLTGSGPSSRPVRILFLPSSPAIRLLFLPLPVPPANAPAPDPGNIALLPLP